MYLSRSYSKQLLYNTKNISELQKAFLGYILEGMQFMQQFNEDDAMKWLNSQRIIWKQS